MTLKEQKHYALSLIEEIEKSDPTFTKDPDIANKINSVINHIQYELSRIKKIPAYIEMEVKEGQLITFKDITADKEYEVYQLSTVKGIKYETKADGTIIKCLEDGIAEIEFYRYPTRIKDDTKDEYEFEISEDVLEIMPYGVAADLLKSDVSNAYGNVYANRYEQMKQQLDIRYNTGSIKIVEGVTV